MMTENKVEKLLDECRQIEEDSMYNAEVHYLIGGKLSRKSFWFKFIPPAITVAAAIGLLFGAPDWASWIALFGALVTITNTLLEPDKKSKEHIAAAREFTVLKHEARSLHEAFSAFMNENTLLYETRRIRDKYNVLAKATPPTYDEAAWQEARRNIQQGRHRADFRERPPGTTPQ